MLQSNEYRHIFLGQTQNAAAMADARDYTHTTGAHISAFDIICRVCV